MPRAIPAFATLAALALFVPFGAALAETGAETGAEASPLVAACDAVAANPHNAANPEGVSGLQWDAFDAAAGVAACAPALAAFPDHLRTIYHLGRANHKLGDATEAERLYQLAAEAGYHAAMAGLLVIYDAAATPEADARALPVLELCASAGDAKCQRQLATRLLDGSHGAARDETRGVSLIEACAAQDEPVCIGKLGEWLVRGDHGLAIDYDRARAVFEVGAAQNDAYSQAYLGWMYDEGVGVAEDDARAVHYYLPAAGAGDFFAQNNLAVHYDEGKGVAEDEGLALYWFEKAAAQGDTEDQYIVAGRYLKGIGTAPDFYKAAEWFRRAAAQGDARAAVELQQMIDDGLVVPGPAD